MRIRTFLATAALTGILAVLVPSTTAGAATIATSTFSGTITSTMSVNDGSNIGSIPAGTAYTGTLTYDASQAPVPAAYGGGTHTTYAFDNLAFTIGTSTANSGPGRIDVYDNLTGAQGYPNGDSIYVNFAGVAPSGLLAGAQFNWMGLALLDSSGVAVTGGALPANFSLSAFPTHFSEFNFGTQGTPWGAGNTSMIQSLTAFDTSGTTPPPSPTVCSGTNGVVTAYVARNPGFIVVNGGVNLLDHLWTSNLNAGNTTFLGGLTNWYQTGLIVSWTGTVDPSAGCILDHLTVSPAVSVATTSLPSATVGVAYQAPVSAAWGVAPYTLGVSGLPAGLAFNGSAISGTPTAAGTYTVTVSATDAVGATASAQLPLTVAQGGNYTIKDESKGKITAIAPDRSYLLVGSKKLIWNASTLITVNTPSGPRTVIDSFVTVGMKVQWKGLRDAATNTVLTSQLEVN